MPKPARFATVCLRAAHVACIALLGISPAIAQGMQPYTAQTLTPHRAQTIQPQPARPVTPTRPAAGMEVHRAQPAPHLLTPAERAEMLENDRRAGRTASSIRGSSGGRAPAQPGCAPNCGVDYSTGRQLPTIYNPNSGNYSPYGN